MPKACMSVPFMQTILAIYNHTCTAWLYMHSKTNISIDKSYRCELNGCNNNMVIDMFGFMRKINSSYRVFTAVADNSYSLANSMSHNFFKTLRCTPMLGN